MRLALSSGLLLLASSIVLDAAADDVVFDIPDTADFVVNEHGLTGTGQPLNVERFRIDVASGNILLNGDSFIRTFGGLFVGLGAGDALTTGLSNTAFGSDALGSNTGGTGNAAIGHNALTGNTLGNNSVAAGTDSLFSNTTGSSNVGIGLNALYFNTTGGENTAVGREAGINATTGSNNIYLGARVYGSAGESDTMYLGGTQTRTFIAGVYGNNMPGDLVVVDSTGRLGTTSSPVQSDGGNNTFSGSGALGSLATGQANVAFGSTALGATTTGSRNVGIGTQSLANNVAGGNNVGVGTDTLLSTSGNANTAVGADALRNATGNSNIGIGHQAGITNTTGDRNIYIGSPGIADENRHIRIGVPNVHTQTYIAGIFDANLPDQHMVSVDADGRLTTIPTPVQLGAAGTIISGIYDTSVFGDIVVVNSTGKLGTITYAHGNTNFGPNAGASNSFESEASNNSAFGNDALTRNQFGSSNTAIGHSSLREILTGRFNTAVGAEALSGLRDDNQVLPWSNIAIGYQAGKNLVNGNNNIYIGNTGTNNDVDQIRIGQPGVHQTVHIAGALADGTSVDGELSANRISATSANIGDVTVRDSLTINGGADIAEPFDITSPVDVQPGMLVSIDANRPGALRIADREYDTAVAGVVSGAGNVNAAIVLRQEGSAADGSHPVALTGRVYAWADADTGGQIRPGDLLTTSSVPGHAMKADPTRAAGAILGKAMSSLDTGTGLVLVLVSLQ